MDQSTTGIHISLTLKALCQRLNDGTCSQCGGRIHPNLRRTCPAWIKANPNRHHRGLAPRIFRYAKALGRWIKSGFLTRTVAERVKLLAICQSCEHFKPYAANKSPSGTCTLCGCGCSGQGILRNKLAMRTEHCPLDPPKW